LPAICNLLYLSFLGALAACITILFIHIQVTQDCDSWPGQILIP